MSVLVNEKTRVIVQGLTGREGTFHAEQMIAYGTNVVAGVTPGKGGTLHIEVPVFDTVAEAVRTDARQCLAIIFVPPPYAADAILEAHRRRAAARRLHHRGHSHAGHGARRRRASRQQDAADRPQLPRHHLARQVQDRHHARPDSQARATSASSAAAAR